MAATKRSEMERERDLDLIAESYISGKSQAAIGRMLGLSQQQIAYDLKSIRERWQVRAFEAVDRRFAEELARLDQLEAAAWGGWERSKSAFRSRTRSSDDVGSGYER